MPKFNIKDKSGGATFTGIVIRKNGHYINVVENEEKLLDFMKDNLPLGTFKRTGQRYTLTEQVPGNALLRPRDEEGNPISTETLATGLGFSFEKVSVENIRKVAPYA